MPAENVCPHCGASLPTHEHPAPTPGQPRVDDPIRDERDSPPVELLASDSNDEMFVANPFGPGLSTAQPDSNLGRYATPSSSSSREASAAIADRASGAHPDRRGGSDSSPAFPSIRIDGASRAVRESDLPVDDDEGGPPEQRNAWASILLMSYASAITLALIWSLWRTPQVREARVQPPAPGVTPTIGRQAGLSRKVALPEPILAKHMVALRQPLQVGSLEVTPLEVRREKVALLRTNLSGKVDRRDGGKNALVLRLKLRNTSKDAVFAPLDQAYLRERDKGLVDTYLETGTGERVYPFPLAVESEWSIERQEFGELRPGETRVVSIVSAPEAPGDEAGPFTWRVRLRTGIDRNDIIGVRWPEPSSARSK